MAINNNDDGQRCEKDLRKRDEVQVAVAIAAWGLARELC